MGGLNQKDVQGFRALLETRRNTLKNEIRTALIKSGRDNYIVLAGEVHTASDESFAEALTGVNLAMIQQQAAELQDVVAALARITAGTYGVCVDCGGDISVRRLRAYPTAKRCAACQRDRENRRGGKDVTPSL